MRERERGERERERDQKNSPLIYASYKIAYIMKIHNGNIIYILILTCTDLRFL